MINKLNYWPAILVAIILLNPIAVFADSDASHQDGQSSTETTLIAITDPEITAAEDEEPDCE